MKELKQRVEGGDAGIEGFRKERVQEKTFHETSAHKPSVLKRNTVEPAGHLKSQQAGHLKGQQAGLLKSIVFFF